MRLKLAACVLIIFAAVILACGCTGTQTTAVAQGGVQDIVVGALMPLSGGLAEMGEASNAALEVSAGDINDYFTSIGSDYRVGLIVEDTKTDPAVALEKLKVLEKQGAKIVIGPGSSVELEAVRAYADEHGILIVGTMSTAPALAIEGDNVFRFVPPDTFQATATAYFMNEEGTRAIVPVWRGDIWGDALRNLTEAAFEEKGGVVLDGVRYVPASEDYAHVAADLDVQVGRAVATYGKEKVGVHAITFEEVIPLMAAAATTHNLSQVRWYGSDGCVLLGGALIESLSASKDAARFSAQTNFTGPVFWQSDLVRANEATFKKIQNRLGCQPDGYSLASYDALWIIAMSATQTTSTDVSDKKIALLRTASVTNGPLCGQVTLDAAGDRSTAHYSFWSIQEDGEYGWVPVAQYDIWSPGDIPDFERIDA